MQIRNCNGRAILLYPRVGSSFAADLFVRITRANPLPDTVRQGEANHDLGLPSLALDSHRDARIEAAMDPVPNLCDTTLLLRLQTKMINDEGLDILAMLINQSEKFVAFFDIGQLEEDVAFAFNNSRISRLPTEKTTFDSHYVTALHYAVIMLMSKLKKAKLDR